MKKEQRSRFTYSSEVPQPVLYPVEEHREVYRYQSPKHARSYEFFIQTRENARVYSYTDQAADYQSEEIPSLEDASIINLFINGVLQPRQHYDIRDGKLILKTDDLPLAGTILILQMIKL